jgi:hypothetical protein
MRTRKARIDSASEAVRVMGKAASAIVPPSSVPLDKCDLPFFASVIAEFARSEWTAHQLELAAKFSTMLPHLEVPAALRKLRDAGFRLFTLTDNLLEVQPASLNMAALSIFSSVASARTA